jgi:hypothetical protein
VLAFGFANTISFCGINDGVPVVVLGAALGSVLGKLLGASVISTLKVTSTGRRVGASGGTGMSKNSLEQSSNKNRSLNAPNEINGDVSGISSSQKFQTSSGRMLEQSRLRSWNPPLQSTTEQELQASPSMVASHVSSTALSNTQML